MSAAVPSHDGHNELGCGGEETLLNGWMPIASAPKDGTDVLLFVPGKRRTVFVGHFIDEVRLSYGRETSRLQQWVLYSGAFALSTFTEKEPPTHWQPLPGPPVALFADAAEEHAA